MSSEAFQNDEGGAPAAARCGAGWAMLAALNDAGCEAKQLASLLELLGDHLDQAPGQTDPLRAAELVADGLQIAQQFALGLSGRAFDAEEACCMQLAA